MYALAQVVLKLFSHLLSLHSVPITVFLSKKLLSSSLGPIHLLFPLLVIPLTLMWPSCISLTRLVLSHFFFLFQIKHHHFRNTNTNTLNQEHILPVVFLQGDRLFLQVIYKLVTLHLFALLLDNYPIPVVPTQEHGLYLCFTWCLYTQKELSLNELTLWCS